MRIVPAKETATAQNDVSAPSLAAAADREGLPGNQGRVLDAIGLLEDSSIEPINQFVAFVAGYSSPDTMSYTNPRGSLKKAGLIEYPARNVVRLTSTGKALATANEPMDGARLRASVLVKLPGNAARLLTALIGVYPESLSNEELSIAAGYSTPDTTSYTNPRGFLKGLGGYDAAEVHSESAFV